MKKIVILGLFLSLCWSTAAISKEPVFVTSDELTLEQVRKTVVNHIKSLAHGAELKEIFGLYRSETAKNNYEIFWSATADGETETSSTTVLRLTSGRWFNADIGEFLTK